ncbi:hypothetical protein SEVIR_3G164701v4 [Setaria viridis]
MLGLDKNWANDRRHPTIFVHFCELNNGHRTTHLTKIHAGICLFDIRSSNVKSYANQRPSFFKKKLRPSTSVSVRTSSKHCRSAAAYRISNPNSHHKPGHPDTTRHRPQAWPHLPRARAASPSRPKREAGAATPRLALTTTARTSPLP